VDFRRKDVAGLQPGRISLNEKADQGKRRSLQSLTAGLQLRFGSRSCIQLGRWPSRISWARATGMATPRVETCGRNPVLPTTSGQPLMQLRNELPLITLAVQQCFSAPCVITGGDLGISDRRSLFIILNAVRASFTHIRDCAWFFLRMLSTPGDCSRNRDFVCDDPVLFPGKTQNGFIGRPTEDRRIPGRTT